MQRVASGDEDAVSDLYDRFGALVYKVSRQLMPTQAEAEDAVQEVFLRLWQTADRFDPRRAKLVTWVMLITRRHLIDRMRRSAVRPSLTGLDSADAADPSTTPPGAKRRSEEGEAKLLGIIAELPELQRIVLERAYFRGYTLRQISEQLDTPLGTIKSALSRGLARMRDRAQNDWKIEH